MQSMKPSLSCSEIKTPIRRNKVGIKPLHRRDEIRMNFPHHATLLPFFFPGQRVADLYYLNLIQHHYPLRLADTYWSVQLQAKVKDRVGNEERGATFWAPTLCLPEVVAGRYSKMPMSRLFNLIGIQVLLLREGAGVIKSPFRLIWYKDYLSIGQSGEPFKRRTFLLAGGRMGSRSYSGVLEKESGPQDNPALKMERSSARTREHYLNGESNSLQQTARSWDLSP